MSATPAARSRLGRAVMALVACAVAAGCATVAARTQPPPGARAGRLAPAPAASATLAEAEEAPFAAVAAEDDGSGAPWRALKRVIAAAPTLPEAERPRLASLLVDAFLRAEGDRRERQWARVMTARALGALRAPEAVDPLADWIAHAHAARDIETFRAVADALGGVGDPRAADALVYGLLLYADAVSGFPYCARALVRLGPDGAVPALREALHGRNPYVAMASHGLGAAATVTFMRLRAAEALALFAAPAAADDLIAVLRDPAEDPELRGAAGVALAHIAVAAPAERPRVRAALERALGEEPPEQLENWTALAVAPALALLADRDSVPGLVRALRHPRLRDSWALDADLQLGLLRSLALVARRADLAAFERAARPLRARLEHLADGDAPGGSVASLDLQELDAIDRALDVVRGCDDGDAGCYGAWLDRAAPSPTLLAKVALTLAWDAPPAARTGARAALLARLADGDPAARESVLVALEALSPEGCGDCVAGLEAAARRLEAPARDPGAVSAHGALLALLDRLRARGAPSP